MLIEVDTSDKELAYEIFGNPKSLGPGAAIRAPGNAALVLEEWRFTKALDSHETIVLLLNFGATVAGTVLANWLSAKIVPKATSIRINKIRVEVQSSEFERILVEQINIEQR